MNSPFPASVVERWLSLPGCVGILGRECATGTLEPWVNTRTYTQGRLFLFDSYNTKVHILFFFSERLLRTSQQSSCTSSSACTLPFLLIKYAVVIPREFWEISWQRAIPWPAVFYSKGKRQSPWWHKAREKGNLVSNKVACNACTFFMGERKLLVYVRDAVVGIFYFFTEEDWRE